VSQVVDGNDGSDRLAWAVRGLPFALRLPPATDRSSPCSKEAKTNITHFLGATLFNTIEAMRRSSALFGVLIAAVKHVDCFTLISSPRTTSTSLGMVMDEGMMSRLDGIRRSYKALTERLGDPDVLADSKLLQKVMSDRAQSEDAVLAYEEYTGLLEELAGAKELFQDAGDDPELREMARAEIKAIEPQLEELEKKMTVLLLPKDPNDERNVMLEIRAGTGGSEANIFAGEWTINSPIHVISSRGSLCFQTSLFLEQVIC
jgi:hypothetical protein